jgi:hypothetical protein
MVTIFLVRFPLLQIANLEARLLVVNMGIKQASIIAAAVPRSRNSSFGDSGPGWRSRAWLLSALQEKKEPLLRREF